MTITQLIIALVEATESLDVEVNVQDFDGQWQNEIDSVFYNPDQRRLIITLSNE